MAGATQPRAQDDLLKTVVEMTVTKGETRKLAKFLEEFAESDNASEKDKRMYRLSAAMLRRRIQPVTGRELDSLVKIAEAVLTFARAVQEGVIAQGDPATIAATDRVESILSDLDDALQQLADLVGGPR